MWSYDEEELKEMKEKLDIKITTTDKDVINEFYLFHLFSLCIRYYFGNFMGKNVPKNWQPCWIFGLLVSIKRPKI